MELDRIVSQIFTAAYNEAKLQKHEYLTPEHILYAALFFEEGIEIIENCDGNVSQLKKDLDGYFKEHIAQVEDGELTESIGLLNVLRSTEMHVISSERDTIRLGDILVAIYDETESYASYFLKKAGIEKLDLLHFISHGVSFTNKREEEPLVRSKKGETEAKAEGSGSKELLSYFTIDLTEKARNGEIDPLIGREDILQRTLQVLCRRLKNNPIHVGDPGVGKTALTEGLAQLIVQGKVPKALMNSRIFYLDMAAMLAGTKYRGDFEERVKKVLQEIGRLEKPIVYIDEIHTLVGTGSVSGGAMDASNILKPFLMSGKMKFIGSTTYEEYKKFFDKDRALSRRFQKIEVSEPSIEDTYMILLGLKDSYEKFHQVVFSENALRLAAELSAKYIQDRHLPDKAIDVIDESGAYARLHAESEEKDVSPILITPKDIERTVSLIAKIPEQSVTSNEVEKLKNLEELLKKEIFGQSEAIDTLVKAIKRSRAGFNEVDKPVSSLLFVGPTGVGKTEISRQLSRILGVPLIRFDMSEYQEKHAVSRLIGAPPGYVGYEEGGLLTEAIRKTPYCVLLLDEIEKAHPDIMNVLLQIMDYATLTENNGKKADFRNVILIMTSNAGAREVGRSLIGFGEKSVDEGAITKEVEKIFSPEFRNRLDEIVVFNPLDNEMALLIAKKAICQLEEKLSPKGIQLKVTDECINTIAQLGFSSKYGAREILRFIQQSIKTYFVDEVLFGELSKGGIAVIDVVHDKIVITKDISSAS